MKKKTYASDAGVVASDVGFLLAEKVKLLPAGYSIFVSANRRATEVIVRCDKGFVQTFPAALTIRKKSK